MNSSMSRALERKMAEAETYDEWREAAIAHDERSGADLWKHKEKSRRYDFGSIRRRLDILRSMRNDNDNHGK